MATDTPTPPREPVRTDYGWGYEQPPAEPGQLPAAPGWEQGHYTDSEHGRTDVPIEHAPRPGARNRSGFFAAAAAVALKLLGSIKLIGPALLKAPFLISILVNIVVYAFLYSTQFGIEFGVAYGTGIVFLIFIHEMGHLIAARMTDTPTTNPLFIPFMGAVIGVRAYRNATIEAINGIGGPILGTLGAMAVYGAATVVGLDTTWGVLLVRLAYIGFFINLFNMIPVTLGGGFTLDGGRILQAVSKWSFLLGPVLILLAITEGYSSGFLWIFLILGLYGTYRRFRTPDNPAYQTTSPAGKAVILLSYLLLLAVLVVGMENLQQHFESF